MTESPPDRVEIATRVVLSIGVAAVASFILYAALQFGMLMEWALQSADGNRDRQFLRLLTAVALVQFVPGIILARALLLGRSNSRAWCFWWMVILASLPALYLIWRQG